MFWVAHVAPVPARGVEAAPRGRALGAGCAVSLAVLVFAMVLTGGLVAGIRAGFAYNTFPLMNGQRGAAGDPDDRAVVAELLLQHGHGAVRPPARRVAARVPRPRRSGGRCSGADVPARARTGAHLLLAMLAVQVALGIATLLLVVPLPLAAAHQAGAVLLFAFALNLAHALRRA